MVLPAALRSELFAFFDSVGLDPALTVGSVTDVQETLRHVVPACLGFQLDLVNQGLTVTLTSFQPLAQAVDVATSLHVPLILLGLLRLPLTTGSAPTQFEPRSSLTLYGSRAGAFVDLAADLMYALGSARRDGPGRDQPTHFQSPDAAVTLDQHLTRSSMTSSFVGAAEVTTINRAMGYLIEEGHDPAGASAELGRRAATAEISVPAYAAQLLGR